MIDSFQNTPLFLIPALTGVIYVILGIVMKLFPPKKINNLYGYRTTSSMKNQERWDFAQKRSSLQFMRLGTLLIVISIFGIFFNPNPLIGVLVGLSCLIIISLILIISVEKSLKSKFENEL